MNQNYDFSNISEEMLGAYLEGTLPLEEAALVSREIGSNQGLQQLAREVQATEEEVDWNATPYDDDPYFDEHFTLPDLEEFEMDDPFGGGFEEDPGVYDGHNVEIDDDHNDFYDVHENDNIEGFDNSQEDIQGEHFNTPEDEHFNSLEDETAGHDSYYEQQPEGVANPEAPLPEDYNMGDINGDTMIGGGFDSGFDNVDDVAF